MWLSVSFKSDKKKKKSSKSRQSGKQEAQKSESTKQQAGEENPDLKLLSDLKNSNKELIRMLREKYPSQEHQEYLGIYVDPKKKKEKKEDDI